MADQSENTSGHASSLSGSYEFVIVGGGHNGMVTAAYLAKNGFKVLVVERNPDLGGTLINMTDDEGFTFSPGPSTLNNIRPDIVTDLKLNNYGLEFMKAPMTHYTPMLEGDSLELFDSYEQTLDSISRLSRVDGQAYEKFINDHTDLHNSFREAQDQGLLDVADSKALVSGLYYGQKSAQSFLDRATSPFAKTLDRYFTLEGLQLTLVNEAIKGSDIHMFTQGSTFNFLQANLGEEFQNWNKRNFIKGGVGKFSETLQKACESAGVEFVTGIGVEEILVQNGKAKGVMLETGEKISASTVISAVSPHETFKNLINAETSGVPYSTLKRIDGIQSKGVATKICFGVDRLPVFNSKSENERDHYMAQILLGPQSIRELYDSHVQSLGGNISNDLVVELTIPSYSDSTLAPKGNHVVEAFVYYTPYTIKGREWDAEVKEELQEKVIQTIERHVPNFGESIKKSLILTPKDYEDTFGFHRGDLYHGSIGIHSYNFSRHPLLKQGYETVIKGLYATGSGTYPAGVSGAAGRNCANSLLENFRTSRVLKKIQKFFRQICEGKKNNNVSFRIA